MSEWQPIETAPKDGTKILMYYPQPNIGTRKAMAISIGAWHLKGAAWHREGGKKIRYTLPTHWMPLPSPPVN